jgi:hypothetical protein
MARSFFLQVRRKDGQLYGCPPFYSAGLLSCCEIDLVNELLEEDRLGDFTLGDSVGAAGVDDGDVCDANKA